ncbi:MAG: ATP-binding protein [Gammaproteobacteria bacterium]
MLADKRIKLDGLFFSSVEKIRPDQPCFFPMYIALGVLVLCLLPTLYYFNLDLSFASSSTPFNIEQLVTWELSKSHLIDEMFYALAGGIQHALLEWTAVVLAFLCVLVSMAHYSMSKDITAPVIGLALFMSGCMDLFHTLAATRLIDSAADNSSLIPFTWAISRSFSACVLLFGVLFLLISKRNKINIKMPQIIIFGMFLFVVVYLLASWMALSDNLPKTQFPDALITRPFDVFPMLIFVVCLPFYWRLYKVGPCFLTAMMFIGLFPDVFSEAYMAFGSDSLFDHHFNSSHGLKILSYALPFLGYLLDYRLLYQEKQLQEDQLEGLNRVLTEKNTKMDLAIENLSHSNEQLERFAFVCSHDLQEPIRMVSSFSQLLEKRLGDELDDKNREYLNYVTDGALRARSMITDILSFCRLEQQTDVRETVALNDVCQQVNSTLQGFIDEQHAEFTWEKTLPELNAVPSQMFQVIMNLVTNGLKFNRSEKPKVNIRAVDEVTHWRIEISDNGIGIDSKHSAKLFQIFERLNAKSEFSGTGIGLAICKKIVEQHGAKIEIESQPDQGSTFILHWPKIEEST